MPKFAPIRILALANQYGDLFGRLVSDLFFSLGYDQPHLNIHKTGREIDVEARHRTEFRGMLAECKAKSMPVGGGDLNKFAGVVEAERRRAGKRELAAYFVSLSGYTESALQQENELGEPSRFALLDGQRLIDELVNGRIVVSQGRALERAGRCAVRAGLNLQANDHLRLLAHELGWIWEVQFTQNKEATHFALIHADGEALSRALAKEVIAADRKIGGNLYRLVYLPPEESEDGTNERYARARQKYFTYISVECGDLELEGLPADQEIGSRRLRLESLFVPLHLEPADDKTRGWALLAESDELESVRSSVGKVLSGKTRLAILALPGGGKTTLLKRLAVAYAFPERRAEIGDDLPNRDWFPLFLRCRQIEDRATEPVTELLAQLGARAEMGEASGDFRSLIYSVLREGRVLLLVDGLDEISDNSKRLAFVNQLRVFLSTYPGVDIVVTSREAGFRVVADSLSSHCERYRIANFDRKDIERLSIAWHREVIGNRMEVENQARLLAATIWQTDRVRRLAVNPLLLTTLLLVRRWVGQLPNRRAVLYEKAIEVLLWTWNVQGFEPLDVQEVTPQLSFLAWKMMEEGIQQISQPSLRQVLQNARRQMPEILGYARLSVDDFVERVERRSGLLVLSGHIIESGRLVPVYEFRHLTFQEYLAAKAVVEGYYPERADADTLVSKLEPHLGSQAWREVIPLAAVLAGRRAQTLIKLLLALSQSKRPWRETGISRIQILDILTQCLLDEVQIAPDLLDYALEAVVRLDMNQANVDRLARSKYRTKLRELVWMEFSSGRENLLRFANALRVIGESDPNWPKGGSRVERVAYLKNLVSSESDADRALSILMIQKLFFRRNTEIQFDFSRELDELLSEAMKAVWSPAPWKQFVGSSGLGPMARIDALPMGCEVKIIQRLLDIWLSTEISDLEYVAARALLDFALLDFGKAEIRRPQARDIEVALRRVARRAGHPRAVISRLAGLIAIFYWREPWDEQALSESIVETARGVTRMLGYRHLDILRNMLSKLGKVGETSTSRLEMVAREVTFPRLYPSRGRIA